MWKTLKKYMRNLSAPHSSYVHAPEDEKGEGIIFILKML